MTLPNTGLPNDLYAYATELYKAISPYVLQGPDNAAALDRAKVAASAQTSAANTSAQGGINVANINAKSSMAQLLPQLALQQQLAEQERKMQIAGMYGSGQLRDNLAGLFAMRGQGQMPAVGSAIPGGMPDLSLAFGGPLAYLPGVRAQVGTASAAPAPAGGGSGGGRAAGGNMGTVPNYPSYMASGPATMPTYSAAAGFDAINRPQRPSPNAAQTGYNVMTGDRSLMTTGRPSGNEEIVRVGPGNQFQGVQPLPTMGNPSVRQLPPEARERLMGRFGARNTGNDDDDGGSGGSRWKYAGDAAYLSRMGQPQPASFNPTDRVGNPKQAPIPYGNDSVVTEIPQSPLGDLQSNLSQVAGLTPNGNNMTAQMALARLMASLQSQAQPTYSAAGGFTPDPSTALRLSNNNRLPSQGQPSSLPSMGDLQLKSRRTPQPSTPAAAAPPAPTLAPAAPGYDVNNLPILQALRNNTALPAFQAFGGPINLNEVGIGDFQNPFQGASTYMRSADPERQQLLDLWNAAGINPMIALSMIQGATPGYRANTGNALSYA